MHRLTERGLAVAVTALLVLGLSGFSAPVLADHTYEPPADYGDAGDATIIVPVNDSAAGGT